MALTLRSKHAGGPRPDNDNTNGCAECYGSGVWDMLVLANCAWQGLSYTADDSAALHRPITDKLCRINQGLRSGPLRQTVCASEAVRFMRSAQTCWRTDLRTAAMATTAKWPTTHCSLATPLRYLPSQVQATPTIAASRPIRALGVVFRKCDTSTAAVCRNTRHARRTSCPWRAVAAS